jgi:putative ABC transport system permease protein
MQLGFKAALIDSSISMIKYFNADLVLVNRLSVSSTSLESFDRARLLDIDGYKGVIETIPVRWGYLKWQYPNTEDKRLVMAIGINPFINTINKSDVVNNQHLLRRPNSILFDKKARPEYGEVAQDLAKYGEAIAFLNDNRVKVVGLYKIGVSFGYDGTLITSDSTFESMTTQDPDMIEIGFIKLQPGVNADAEARIIRQNLPEDVQLFTLKEFENFEINYWQTSRPIGFVFGFGAVMGFLVGLIIIYQILYSDISVHIHEYGTMLSIGFSKQNLNAIVINESLIICLCGYPIGLLISFSLYSLVTDKTRIILNMTAERSIGVLFLVIGMSICSAILAMRRLNDADPTEVFT